MKRQVYEWNIRWLLCIAVAGPIALVGCGGEAEEEASDVFATSGSREADQRAEQRIAKEQQIRGEEADKDKDAKTLYDRLGGEEGLTAIVDDFAQRALADPRVNFRREGVRAGSVFRVRDRSAEWDASAENIARLKKHMTQFLALATGGPARYEGRNMHDVHEDMKITNSEFDAAIGDMKATLDARRIATEEQKELLAILETTRPQIVTEK